MAEKISRPVSPHLQIYRPQVSWTLSIAHRIAGIGLSVGALFLVCWLLALAAGPEQYEAVMAFSSSILGRLMLLGFTGAINYHLLNGIRHLFWDAGKGFSIPVMNRTGWTVLFGAIVLTLIEWALAYGMGG